MSDTPQWLLAPDSNSLYKKAAQLFVETVSEAIRVNKGASVALSGGETPKGLFETLAEPYFADRIHWSKLHVFFVDERCVPPQHADSNFGLAQKYLFSKVPLPQTNVHRLAGEMSPPSMAAKAYEDELKAFFKLTESWPHFDLVLLGVGQDGHTASLFPGTDALTETDHWVVETSAPAAPAKRLTFTFPLLNSAKKIIFIVSGTGKAEILKVILSQASEDSHFPVQRIRPENGETVWLFDKEAASKLPSEVRFKAFHL